VTALLESLALACTAAGLLAGLVVMARTGKGLLALAVALDLWTAAGLLRLAGPPSWARLAGAAAIIALRQLLGLGLRASSLTGIGGAVVERLLRPAWRQRHPPLGE
jgi:hypothetical protein